VTAGAIFLLDLVLQHLHVRLCAIKDVIAPQSTFLLSTRACDDCCRSFGR
jgi:hypothetical protein